MAEISTSIVRTAVELELMSRIENVAERVTKAIDQRLKNAARRGFPVPSQRSINVMIADLVGDELARCADQMDVERLRPLVTRKYGLKPSEGQRLATAGFNRELAYAWVRPDGDTLDGIEGARGVNGRLVEGKGIFYLREHEMRA